MIYLVAALLAVPLQYTGTNLSGAEFGKITPGQPPEFGKQYTYPTEQEVAYFSAKGMNVFRIPFHWEALQHSAGAKLDPAELDRLTALARTITKRKLVAILDPHNYGRYQGQIISGPDLASLWRQLATHFKEDRRVWFGLMNEPHDMPSSLWLSAANSSIAEIRRAGAKNLILVPGNHWTGAHSWTKTDNATVMRNVKDPLNHFVFEVHQYLDVDSSGSHREVVSPIIGAETLKIFAEWCRKHKKRAFLGEFGVDASEPSRVALTNMLTSMQKDRDVWLGFTWWSAGPWWGDYMFSIEPKDGQDKPQLTWLKPFLQGSA